MALRALAPSEIAERIEDVLRWSGLSHRKASEDLERGHQYIHNTLKALRAGTARFSIFQIEEIVGLCAPLMRVPEAAVRDYLQGRTHEVTLRPKSAPVDPNGGGVVQLSTSQESNLRYLQPAADQDLRVAS